MQIDMHFYGTYALARMAGFVPELASTIATAAQFVDNAVSAAPVSLEGDSYLLPVVSAHELIELDKNFDRMDQWRVWVPFHFLPGGQGNSVDDRLVCLWGEPGNTAADDIIRLALEAHAEQWPHALHLLGIVTHVIQDTYAHYGFSGIAHGHNLIDQKSLTPLNVGRLRNYILGKLESFFERAGASFAEASRLGHAGAATFPDRPYLRWELDYEQPSGLSEPSLASPRDNPETFFRACTRIHAIYRAFLNGEDSPPEDGHLAFSPAAENEIRTVLAFEGSKEERSERWREAIESGLLFQPETDDMELHYSHKGWGMQTLNNSPQVESTQAYQFNRAARRYLKTMLGDILPSMNILVR